MDAFVNGKRLALTDADLLGVGGEGRVYRQGARAVKIFHEVPPGLAPAERARCLRELARKIAKLRDFPRQLPKSVIAPIDLVESRKGEVIGFTMAVVDGASDVLRVGQRRWREGVMTNDAVASLFKRIHSVLVALHARGVVVGDLNDGNIVFEGTTPFFIDADSMQFGAHPCTVAHERFLDPKLYGVDLSAKPAFGAESDWYAYAVLLFASLLFVHPYGGSHASYPTPLRRAEAGHSILRSDVVYPRAAADFRVLSDDMLAWFGGIFDEGRRGIFPEPLLEVAWTRCTCGVEHARTACPSCTARVAVPAVTTVSGCRVTSVFKTTGRILRAAMQGGLRYAYEENGVVRREDGSRVLDGKLRTDMRIALAGATTWIGENDRLQSIVRERVTRTLSIGTLRGAPAFDASVGGCFHTAGDWIMNAESGARVGQILEGQTFVRMGPAFGFGFYRAERLTSHFLIRPGGAGLKHVALPHLDGRLIDVSAVFDGTHVLFSTAVENDGKRTHAMHLVDDTGSVVASCSGAPLSRPALAHTFGKCVRGASILCATDEGLLLVRADSKTGLFTETKTFAETRPFVTGGSDILAGPGGSVYLVFRGEITQLSLA